MALWVYAAIIAGNYVYHRLTDDPDPKPIREKGVGIPVIEEGAAVPLYWGRVRIDRPILAAHGPYTAIDASYWNMDQAGGAETLYGIDQHYILGIPFQEGQNALHSMWAGDTKMTTTLGHALSTLTGNGDHEVPAQMQGPTITDRNSNEAVNYPCGFGLVEFLNGNASQVPIDAGTILGTGNYDSKTYLADRLSDNEFYDASNATLVDIGGTIPVARFPGYRGYTSAFLFAGKVTAARFDSSIPFPSAADYGAPIARPANVIGTRYGILPWIIGASAQCPAYSFEASTYPNTPLDQLQIGYEANPADVIWSILRDTFAKLGLDYTRVDYETFRACAERLTSEAHGYSRVVSSVTDASELIAEILRQIDGVLYEDPWDGLIKLKLIRADFKVSEARMIDPSNCDALRQVAAHGWNGVVNKVRVVFTDRSQSYKNGSATAINHSVASDGAVEELVLHFPGICTQALADAVAARELSARSRPIMRFRAEVNRTFWDAIPGEAVALTWPKYGISGVFFRVARVDRGAKESNTVVLDLVQDFFALHRFDVTDTGGLPSHPGEAVG